MASYIKNMTDAQITAATNRRIADYQRELCDRVIAGEITDSQANELAAEFQDRIMRDGPWS